MNNCEKESRYQNTKEVHYQWLVRIVSLACIVAGIIARAYRFGSIPPGLNQDEASVGYDAWTLLHYGTDSSGISFPVHRIAWGNGGNASYAYMAAPFVMHELTPFAIRLPMLLSAFGSLILIWLIVKRLFGEKAAWGSTAVVALSPWHIMLSRWALDCNALPFLFLCGLAPLVISATATRRTAWLVGASVMFGVSVYAYGAAYLAVPLFLVTALVTCVVGKVFTMRQAAIAISVFTAVGLPIALFVLVNLFHLNSISFGGITIPRLPTEARFQSQLAAGPLSHFGQLSELLITQRDGTTYNVTDPYGVLYSTIYFCLAFGVVAAVPVLVKRGLLPVICLFVPLWVIACVPTGLVQTPNINRVNLLLMGIVLAVGVALAALDRVFRGAFVVCLLSMSIMFGLFVRDYFTSQSRAIAEEFFDGLIPAIRYAKSSAARDGRICVTAEVNMPQTYVLFAERPDPQDFLNTVKYIDPTAPFRETASYGRYIFGLKNCDFMHVQAVVARREEGVPGRFGKVQEFSMFDVYTLR